MAACPPSEAGERGSAVVVDHCLEHTLTPSPWFRYLADARKLHHPPPPRGRRRRCLPSPPAVSESYPRTPTPCDSLPHPLHRSEIMTSGWCGGGWVVRESFRARPKVPRHGPVRWPSRCKRTECPQGAPGSEAAMHKAVGRGGQCRVARVVRLPTLFAMRHGMLPGRGTIRPKSRSAGEARAS